MVLRELFDCTDDVAVIARAIFEDGIKDEKLDGWITKYFAQLSKLRKTKIYKSDTMLYFSTESKNGKVCGDVSGLEYSDLKAEKMYAYTIAYLNCKQYASLYVPDETIKLFGCEAVVAEALREYGWNGYDTTIVCPSKIRGEIKNLLKNMSHDLSSLEDKFYFERCRQEFVAYYEGRYVPQWENKGCGSE